MPLIGDSATENQNASRARAEDRRCKGVKFGLTEVDEILHLGRYDHK